MTTYTYTPTTHSLFSEIDSLGLLLGTPRLEEEQNAEYKQRLLDVFVHRANSSYLGLIYGITRELGYSVFEAIRIVPVMNGNIPLGNNPAVVFDETKCYIYHDISDTAYGLATTLDRFEINGGYYTLNELIDGVNESGYFTASLQSGIDGNYRSMLIYNQSTTTLVTSENIGNHGAVIKLENRNLLESTITISSPNITERVLDSILLTKTNQYYVDTETGILYTGSVPDPSSRIRYKYRNDNYYALASPVIIHNLQSADFKTKMFNQILQLDNTNINSYPTILGADLLNELMTLSSNFVSA